MKNLGSSKKIFSIFIVFFIVLGAQCPGEISSEQGEVSDKNHIYEEKNYKDQLALRVFSDFEKVQKTTSGNKGKWIYRDRKNPKDLYVMTEGTGGVIEAYAGILYRFLLGKYSSFTLFVWDEDKKKIYGASKLNDSFKDAYSYFVQGKRALLAPGKGLEEIIVASVLLADIDLKGLSSAGSNLGVVDGANEQHFFKIDHEDSFTFDNPATKNWFDLSWLKEPKANNLFLETLGFKKIKRDKVDEKGLLVKDADGNPVEELINDFTLTSAYLENIKDFAQKLLQVNEANLLEVLDFCETQLQKLPVYPKGGIDGAEGVLSSAKSTYKEAILERFQQLKAVFSP